MIVQSTLLPSSSLLKNHRDSLRRHFVDDFYMKKIAHLPKGSLVLDLGGNRRAKRGLFNIDSYRLDVVYVNYAATQSPDIQADAASLPFMDASFDGVVCAEVLEHIRRPGNVLKEVHRVLRSDATLLLTVPFMFPVHADPYDYGRYTDRFWQESLEEIGFTDIYIEWQGGFWCVWADMLRGYMMEKEKQLSGTQEKVINWMNVHLQKPLKKKVLKWDMHSDLLKTFFMKGCTTGFGVTCRKK
ncbi:MAG: class I SAM-dependent methyltransferase [Candidatus Electrothrix sp. AR4]|nr:class I SAM-dependent methyltransferase [Candidatus Electrothrix sp. AR4]